MNKRQVADFLLKDHTRTPVKPLGEAFSPSNIALCKYWGKRNTELNLPMNASLSISLDDKGAHSRIQLTDHAHDVIVVNGKTLEPTSVHAKRTSDFLALFKQDASQHYQLDIDVNIPLAAGLASSACLYASLVKSIDDFYGWELDHRSLSILARLGSGSAARSIETGFVEWHQGTREDGLDSFAEALDVTWPALRIGLAIVTNEVKPISSRAGMQRTVETSLRYQSWPDKAATALQHLKTAIDKKNFELLGETAEANAKAMHATMLDATPPIVYSTAETHHITSRVSELRKAGLPVYYTQDAGPNIKLLFLSDDQAELESAFPGLEIVDPFKAISC